MVQTTRTEQCGASMWLPYALYLTTIGKIWGDGSLKDPLAEFAVCAAHTVEMIMIGKQFHQAVQVLVLVYECLVQMKLERLFDLV